MDSSKGAPWRTKDIGVKESIKGFFGIDLDSDVFSPIVDYAWKRIFTADEERSKIALIDFLNSVLTFEGEKSIVDLTVVNPDIPVDISTSKKSVFDVRVKFNDGEQAIAEMQMYSQPDFKKRSQFLISKTYISQPIVGLAYSALKKCYLICLMNFTLLHDKSEFANDYRFRDREGNDLTDDETIVFIELPKIDKILNKPVEEMTDLEMWAIFFRFVSDKSKRDIINKIIGRKEGVRMAASVLEIISKDEIERIRYENELIFDLDQRSRINGAVNGAIKERDIEIALAMYQKGFPIETIAECLKTTAEKIAELISA